MGGAYEDMLRALVGARRFGIRFDLARLRSVLAELAHPEERMGAIVHVGGTNGKGSTCALVESALRQAGYKTGLYTSPHLCRFTERIRIGGDEVSGDELAARWADMTGRISGVALENNELTFFEQVTLLGFTMFAAAATDVVVLEVGLGGRLDATNVVDPTVACVTGVALDHEEHLGRDLGSIAQEKGGIFKPGRCGVVGASGEPTGQGMLVAEAWGRGVSELVVVARDIPAPLCEDWEIGLPGPHQRANAACAAAVLDALRRHSAGRIQVSIQALREGFRTAFWPGRLERVPGPPDTWLDGAHNPHGAQALARALDAHGVYPRVVVVGVSAEKDAASLLGPIVSRAPVVIATQAPTFRALPAAELGGMARTLVESARLPTQVPARVIVEPDYRAAMEGARKEAGNEGAILVYGSLFLVGAVRADLLDEPRDPLVTQDPAR
ncbi:MAG: bifunctional folylpolyglutamate synthase/dihydrofolate synthase [Deltaproteobacteria bacterium]|nr:bifunctional folylpolyglutamate synthase/dihydrofolate synthase [Deltaproteobacteria bacterium]